MGFMTEKFEKLKQEANLQVFLSKDEITEKGREKRKLEAKKDKTGKQSVTVTCGRPVTQDNGREFVNTANQIGRLSSVAVCSVDRIALDPHD